MAGVKRNTPERTATPMFAEFDTRISTFPRYLAGKSSAMNTSDTVSSPPNPISARIIDMMIWTALAEKMIPDIPIAPISMVAMKIFLLPNLSARNPISKFPIRRPAGDARRM